MMSPAVWLVLLALLAGCSVRETLDGPNCEGNGSGLIAAQSVPTATFLPCFDTLPPGWDIASVQVDQEGTRVLLHSDRAGQGAAAFHFVEACHLASGAVATPSDRVDTARFDAIEQVTPAFRASRFYLFEGGCVWWRFDFDREVPSALSIEIDNSVTFLDRQVVNDNVRDTFIDADI